MIRWRESEPILLAWPKYYGKAVQIIWSKLALMQVYIQGGLPYLNVHLFPKI